MVTLGAPIWVVALDILSENLVHGHHHALADYLGVPLMAANGYDILMELCYVLIFIKFAVGQRRWHVVGLIVITIMSVIVVLLLELKEWSRTFVGYIVMVFGVVMYAIPVYIMVQNSSL